MTSASEQLKAALSLPEYPRSASYDPEWMIASRMGPNVVWLTEALAGGMMLESGMRVLDMGCGMAASSIFLAREFGVEVWATDLWVSASDNWQRIRDAGMEKSVFPIHADAHTLPFAEGFFDASVSLDAYHYFGTDDLIIGKYAPLVKPGGQIGIVVPGLTKELLESPPKHLEPYWEWEFCSFHTPGWWRAHWEKSGQVEVILADLLPRGHEHWLTWNELWIEHGNGPNEGAVREAEMLRADAGQYLGFARVVARRK